MARDSSSAVLRAAGRDSLITPNCGGTNWFTRGKSLLSVRSASKASRLISISGLIWERIQVSALIIVNFLVALKGLLSQVTWVRMKKHIIWKTRMELIWLLKEALRNQRQISKKAFFQMIIIFKMFKKILHCFLFFSIRILDIIMYTFLLVICFFLTLKNNATDKFI